MGQTTKSDMFLPVDDDEDFCEPESVSHSKSIRPHSREVFGNSSPIVQNVSFD